MTSPLFPVGHSRRLVAGFTLIEVLIALVVLGTGLLALGGLQAGLARNAADSRARSQVAAFADLILERQRAQGYVAVPAGNVWTSAELAAIQQQAGVSNMSVASLVSTTFDGNADTPAAGVEFPGDNAQFKRVTVVLTWTDSSGQARRYESTTIISPRSVLDSDTPIDRDLGLDGGAVSPVVRVASPAATGVIPIAIGNNSETAATNPEPEIEGSNNNSQVVGTSFQILTYQNDQNNFVRSQKRIETKVIRCQCDPGNVPTGDFSGVAQWPAYWNGTKYTVYEGSSDAPGVAAATGPLDTAVQSELCLDCCRDHHDSSATGLVRFSPQSAGAHVNFGLDGTLRTNATRPYLEACRMIRVDGFWRTAADLQQDFFGLLATSTRNSKVAGSPVPDPGVTDDYEDFVIAFMEDLMDQKVFGGNGPPDAAALYEAEGLNAPASIEISKPTPADERYLHARGLYTDHLEADAIEVLQDADDACDTTTQTQIECLLPYIPFTTINATELASWAPQRDGLSVTNSFSLVFDPDLPTRGRVNAVAATTVTEDAALVSMKRHNSGVAIMNTGINIADSVTSGDSQAFAIQGAGGGNTGTARVVLRTATVLPTLDDTDGTDPAVGITIGTTVSNTATESYSNADKARTYDFVNLPTAGATTITIGNYNRRENVTRSITCNGQTFNNQKNVPVCYNYAFTSSAGTVGTPTADGTLTEANTVTLTAPPTQAVTITFSNPTVTQAAIISCTVSGNKVTPVFSTTCP